MSSRARPVRVEVVVDDALTVDVDVLVLKYAQEFYGVDKQVAAALPPNSLRQFPGEGGFCFVPSEGAVAGKHVLFVGVPALRSFRYREIRVFARKALEALAGESPGTRTVAMTLHGAGYGLDEAECFRSELAGLAEAVASADCPDSLEAVLIVERNAGRARRLQALLAQHLPGSLLDPDHRSLRERIGEKRAEALQTVGYDSGEKPYVFVAMPINVSTEDLFHYGIRQAVDQCDLLCERIDQTPATGDILDRIRQRIAGATFVVADLSDRNANVYLEVGFAWGRGIPTVLLIKSEQLSDLGFDVKGQRCVVYGSIRDLENKLATELRGLLKN